MLRRSLLVSAASPLAALFLLVAALAFAWLPVVLHYRLPVPAVPASIGAAHRHEPADAVLAEIAAQSLPEDIALDDERLIGTARRLLAGELALPGLDAVAIAPAFAADDLRAGRAQHQFALARLIVVDVLLRAFEATSEPSFFAGARTYLLEFIAFEARQRLPTAYLWNERALSARAGVLARFWRLERQVTPADDHVARQVALHATRIAEMLSKPSHFVARSHHGMQQNLALLQIAAAFPGLPRAAAYRGLALERLHDQLAYWMSDEGVVLEHSASYHAGGTILLQAVLRTLDLSGEPVPQAWRRKHEKALAFLAHLQRPDGTLPLIGDTIAPATKLPRTLRNAAPIAAALQYPVAGYTIVHEALAAAPPVEVHAVIPWSYFPGQPAAQELSLLLWAGGTTWLTNSGSWTANDDGSVAHAVGWEGGNAPHVVGEATDSPHRTRLHAVLEADRVRLFDFERTVTPGPRVRRQVLQIDGLAWLVFDTYADALRRPLRVLWTTAPGVELRNQDDVFALHRPGAAVSLTMSLHGTPAPVVHTRFGSRQPFGGWVAVDNVPTAAHAIDARVAEPDGWLLTAFAFQTGRSEARDPIERVFLRAPDVWRVTLESRRERVQIERAGQALVLTDAGGRREFALQAGPDVAAPRAAIAAAFAEASEKYPRYRDIEAYRARASLVLGGTWLVLQLGLLPLGLRASGPVMGLRALAHTLWALGAAWIVFVYLAV